MDIINSNSPSARVSRAFPNSRNFPACLDQAIQTQKPQSKWIVPFFDSAKFHDSG